MPFTQDGIRPDIIINPHALPSRMTIGQLVETLMGKTCANYGGFGDCTAFVNKGSKHEVFGKLLNNIGYNSTGNEILYSGETGQQLQAELFIGPCYYMRLKHMVKDKINYRAQGPRTVLTRQTVQGRANDGGLRIGEMERDCIIAHGASKFLNESMLKRGDEYFVAICNNTGTIAIYNQTKNIFISPFADGPLKFNNNIENEQNIEVVTKYGRNFSIIKVPYSFKLLMQELQVMNIQMRIITEDNIDQLTSMNYKNTLEIMKNKVLNSKQKTEFDKIANPYQLTEEDDKDLEITKEISKTKLDEEDQEYEEYQEHQLGQQIKKTSKKQHIQEKEKEKEKEKEEQEEEEEEEEDIDEEDNEGLSPVTVEAVKKAKEDYEKYKASMDEDSEEEEEEEEEEESKPPLTLGEQLSGALDNFVQTLTKTSKDKTEKQEKTTFTENTSPIVFEKQVKTIEKEPTLKEDSILSIETEKATKETDTIKSSSLEESNLSNSEKEKP